MIKSKSDYRDYLKRDYESNNFNTGLLGLFGNDIKTFLQRLRYLEYVTNTKTRGYQGLIRLIALYKFKKISKKLGYSIPPNVCGYGLCLPHYGNIIINRKSRIGNNCKIHVGVNIGGGHDGTGKTPVLGHNCYIAPGAKIFGGVVLGNNTTIGANAVVNRSFLEDGHVLVGVPAKSIRIEAINDKT